VATDISTDAGHDVRQASACRSFSDKLKEALIKSLYREAVATQSPGLPGFGGYPGDRWKQVSNLEEVASTSLPARFIGATFGLAQLLWGWIACSSFPRVAAKARQPWALSHNRFAVKRLNQSFLKVVGHLFQTLLLALLVSFNSCGSTSKGSAPPVSAEALLREYHQSSAWVRQKYDGKEISVRGLVMSAIVLPGDTAEQGTVWLNESESETSGKVGCWFSHQQAAEFSKISSGQYLTIRGVFNGEAGVDLKFCRLVKIE
jgi:hypothetical protein